MRHSRITYKQMMEEVEHSMSGHGSRYQPRIRLEAEYGQQQEPARGKDFDHKGPSGATHKSEQHIL